MKFRRLRVPKPIDNIVVAALQPKGRTKINCCRFPPQFLNTLVQEIKTNPDNWYAIKEATIHDNNCGATLEYSYAIHEFKEDLDAARNSKLYLALLNRILQYPGSKLLGCGDIWTCLTPEELLLRDTDCFFLTFPCEEGYDIDSMHSME